MQVYFYAAGIGSVLYYILLVRYTGKWDSTFSRFWIVCGGGHVLLGFFFSGLLPTVQVLLEIGVVVWWFMLLAVGGKILSCAGETCGREVDFLIVLGAQVRGTRITQSLKRRLDSGHAYLVNYPNTKVVVSGGQGKGEDVSEAQAMAEYLIRCGVEPERIIQEDRSTSTWENLCFSLGCLTSPRAAVAVVTNDFHLYRALLLAKKAGYKNLFGIAASSNGVLLFNYLVREIFAVILTKARQML